MHKLRRFGCGLLVVVMGLCPTSLLGQRVRFPASNPQNGTLANGPPVTLGEPVTPPFDPYGPPAPLGTSPVPAIVPSPAPSIGGSQPPSLGTTPVPSIAPNPVPSIGGSQPPSFGTTPAPSIGPAPLSPIPPNAAAVPPALPATPTPFTQPNAPLYQPLPPATGPGVPGPPFPPTQPSAVFPNGLGLFSNGAQWPQWGGGAAATAPPPYQRFFDDFYVRYTWLEGESAKLQDLEMQEVEIALSAVFPSLFSLPVELRITPGFVFDFLQGPLTPGAIPDVPPTTQLPAQLYSAYLDTAWNPKITPQFSAEVNARLGIYSDFETVTSHSVRITGTGLAVLQLTPTVTLKGGIEFLDRNDIKLLPAGGILWEPDPQTRFDIYFPRPKIAKYLSTLGNNEIWWYLGGEYGGGSWTFEHGPIRSTVFPFPVISPSYSERIDINDIRVFGGVDVTRPSGMTAFFEVGFVFEREIIYVLTPADFTTLNETFMLRAGIVW